MNVQHSELERIDRARAIHEVELAGPDRALERGSYEIALTPAAGGDPLRDSGKYLTIYRRAPGHEWLITNDIRNSDIQRRRSRRCAPEIRSSRIRSSRVSRGTLSGGRHALRACRPPS
jgi:hypothetical protein